METNATDWVIVQAYLQQHGQATHRELITALSSAGVEYNKLVLLMRLNRCERHGWVSVRRFADSTLSLVKLSDVCGNPHAPTGNTI